jgi:hypothetical protein
MDHLPDYELGGEEEGNLPPLHQKQHRNVCFVIFQFRG